MQRQHIRSQGRIIEGEMVGADCAPVSEDSAFNAEEYLPEMTGFDLSEEQARELLATLWEIMKAFVDLGFGVESIHEFLPAWREISQEIKATEVDSKGSRLVQKFDQSAQRGGRKEEES